MPSPKFFSWIPVVILALVLGACGDSAEPESAQPELEDGSVDVDAMADVDATVDVGVEVDGASDAEVDGAMDAALVDCTEAGCPAVENGANACVDGVCVVSCDAGFVAMGNTCANIDDCVDDACLNGGECVDGIEAYTCECAPGYRGIHCEGETCGDGVRTISEECDDGNLFGDDGCDLICRTEWGYFCDEEMGLSQCASVCGDGIRADDEQCDDANADDLDGCSAICEVEVPVTFACAIANHEAQVEAAPDYWYAQAHGGAAPTAERQPIMRTWEPILESVPGCNGLPYDSDAVDPGIKAFSFLIVLDASWVRYYAENSAHFATQGYPTIESSPRLLVDRATHIFEAQFGARIGISRVEVFPELMEKCATNNNHAENDEPDETNTWTALESRGLGLERHEAGVIRIGVGAADGVTYCHSAAPLNGLCTNALFINQRAPFEGDSGRVKHEAARVLVHELGHFFGLCNDNAHPHCQNNHTANEIPDLMVWDGTPAVNVRDFGMFYKFMPSCTPLYDTLVCERIKRSPSRCGVPLTCANGGLDCIPTYWSTRGSAVGGGEMEISNELRPRGDRLAVRCCSDDEPARCQTADLGGLVSRDGSRECSGVMTWPEANRFCRQAALRLCSLEEIENHDLCAGTGCGYDSERVWTRDPGFGPADLLGDYLREPNENEWHEVTVELSDEGGLSWLNAAGVSWSLLWVDGELWAGPDCPYGEQRVGLAFETDNEGETRLKGLRFGQEFYGRR